MKSNRKSGFEGIILPLAAGGSTGGPETPLSDSDLQKLQGIYGLYKELRAVLEDRLGDPMLLGSEIRMALNPDPSLANYTADQLFAQLELTAAQLKKNAARTAPLPYGKALTHASIGKLLETLSSSHRKSGTSLVVCSGDNRFEAPILESSAFIQPGRPEDLRMTGTFEITGVRRSWKGGPLGLYIGENVLLLELPTDDARWDWKAVHDVLEQPTHLVGTVVRESKSSPWRPDAGARLERQGLIKETSTPEAA